ncbi:MAG: hypothetical protein H8M99_03140 [Gloeobacteraceae cyanobacterium ES-bin-144]|nr:hypothetical protein [Verrucomicrobiales bacterium]
MKKRAFWFLIPVAFLGLSACDKKKPEVKAPEVPTVAETPVAAAPTPPAPVAKAPVLSPEERATKLGFAQFMPQDTEVVMSFYNGVKSVDRIKSSKIWKAVAMQMGLDDGGMTDLDEASQEAAKAAEPPADAEPSGPTAMFAKEITITMGKTTGEQAANLLTMNRRMSYFQMRSLAKALVVAAKSGDSSAFEETMANQYGPELFKDLLADPESGIATFEKMNMPPMYFAFRTSEDQLATSAQQIASVVGYLAMMEGMTEPVEIEKSGKKFAGYKISGAKLSATITDSRDAMDEMMDPATTDKLIAAVAKKDIVILSGTIGNYVVLFMGSSADQLNFASDVKQSLVASDALAFCDAYVSKDLASVIYGEKNACDQVIAYAGGLADMTNGIRDGLAGSDGLGDIRDIEALLRMVGEREAALRKLASNDAVGIAAFFEDGLKVESYGGSDYGAVDWKSPNRLAALGDSADVVLFANMTTEAAYDEKARAYFDSLLETSYAVAMKISELPLEEEKMAQFKEMTKLFDTEFRTDVVAMWDAFSEGCGDSLGNESALIVDLNGSVPALPGIPQAVVNEGKFPRISIISPVTDRAKLASSWEKMNASSTNLLTKVSKMTGKEIPMQKPISSDKGGYTTWFYSLPFFNDDFMPSVTVGDQWFAASTSKNQALDLLNKAAASKETRTGLYFTMNFVALQKFSRESLEVVKKNSAAIFGEEGMTDQQMKNTENLIDAMGDLDKLTVNARREGGVLRTSLHFKTR